MDLDQIFNWILKHPKNYPGKHQESQPRVLSSYKPLEPRAQFHIIFKATSEYIKEKMQDGKGVNIRNFGAFCFEVFSDSIKPAQYSNFDVTKNLIEQRLERKHVHKVRPCFIPDKPFKTSLQRYAGKEEISAPKSQHSIYQQGFGMMFCNPGPIASSCFLGKEVVKSAHEAFVKAVIDLTDLGYDLSLDFGFCKLMIIEKSLTHHYRKDFAGSMNQKGFELKMRKSDTKTQDFWSTTYQDRWATSGLNFLFKRPNSQDVQKNFEKTLALKIMSLDMNTAEKTEYSREKMRTLPPLANNKK